MNVLIAVDVQRDFIDGSLAVPDAAEIIEPLLWHAADADLVVATADWHPLNHNSFTVNGGKWPLHCVAGTPGSAIDERLQEVTDVFVFKGKETEGDGYSGFDGTDLDEILVERGDGNVTVKIAGLATDYCVLRTALDSAARGYRTVVLIDACRGVAPDTTDAAIQLMSSMGIEVRIGSRKHLVVTYDVTDLTDAELGVLEIEAVVQGERSKPTWEDDPGHPDVKVTSHVEEWTPGMLPASASAVDLIDAVLQHSRRRGRGVMGGLIGDVLSVWLGERVEAWFAGENDKVYVWEIAVPEHLSAALEARVKGVVFQAIASNGSKVYRVTRQQGS